jgi:hypothetical protein
MDPLKVEDLLARLDALRGEAERLADQAGEVPALRCNTARLLACVRMMEMDLGRPFREPTPAETAPGRPEE